MYYLLLTAHKVNGVLLFWKNEFSMGVNSETHVPMFRWQFEAYWDCNYNQIDDDSKNEACHVSS